MPMTTASVRPVHFLLVEDEQAHADLVQLVFEDNNITNTIDHVSDGEEAWAYLCRDGKYADAPTPDVILLDLNLPKLNGHEVLERIKKDETLHTIPVVILTTSANEKDRARAYDRHVNSFLTKPIDFEQFQQLINDLKLYWTVWNQPPVSTPN